jgi:predicted acylesterase/phospholipase RssA
MMHAYGCFSGCGTAITGMLGAADEADNFIEFVGASGASGGAMVAAKKMFGVNSKKATDRICELLDGNIIKFSVDALGRGGCLNWHVIGNVIDELFGVNCKLGDSPKPLVIAVTDLDWARQMYLSSTATPNVLLRDAIMASSAFMAFATPACKIPSLGTKLSPDIRLFSDGGYTDNTVDDVFDNLPCPRILFRLKDEDFPKRIRDGDVFGIHGAVFRSMLWSANKPKSKRHDGLIVPVNVKNDWDFTKTKKRIQSEYLSGQLCVRALQNNFK